MNFYRIRKYTDSEFPKRLETDRIVEELGSWKSASEKAIEMNRKIFEDNDKYYKRFPTIEKNDRKYGRMKRGYYVEEIEK